MVFRAKQQKGHANSKQRRAKKSNHRMDVSPGAAHAKAPDFVNATSSLAGVIWQLSTGGLIAWGGLWVLFQFARWIWNMDSIGGVIFLLFLSLLILSVLLSGLRRTITASRELPDAYRVSARGKVIDGTVKRVLETGKKVDVDRNSGLLGFLLNPSILQAMLLLQRRGSLSDYVPSRMDYFYYAVVEYEVDGLNYAIQAEITQTEFLKLDQGSILKVRYLAEDPFIAKLW